MPIPINIEDLLLKRKIESNRIEFKKSWNPDGIYRSICAFANDFDNIGGGYIVVGVEEENGIAKRPVLGISNELIDKIQKEIIGYDNMIEPYYMPRVDVQELDGKSLLIIWVPAGVNRPYSVRERVTNNKSSACWYVRHGSCTIKAKGEVLNELREMANRTPFDERGNENIAITDISPTLVVDYLHTVKSHLARDMEKMPLTEVLDQMDLLTGPKERRLIKNVAAMMFCKNPATFFPVTQVDIVIFPEGCVENPNNMFELPKIVGPVPDMIKQSLDYIKTNIIKKHIIKQKDQAESITYFNYPYQAIEEAVVNALYHRDYQEHEPVEITIEPKKISILSYAGPDRSISLEEIKKAERFKSRRYRNRRLGDFLKELQLSEGRCTGIPTIQEELRRNGSAPARIETDENRTYFLIEIPCREELPQTVPYEKTSKLQTDLLTEIASSYEIKKAKLAEKLKVSQRTISRIIQKLSSEPLGLIKYQGSKKTGGYVLTQNGKNYLNSLIVE